MYYFLSSILLLSSSVSPYVVATNFKIGITLDLRIYNTVESQSIVFEGDGENKRWMRKNDQSKYVVLSSSKVS